MKTITLIIIASLFFVSVYSQDKQSSEYFVNLKAIEFDAAAYQSYSFNIDIFVNQGQVKVVYSVLDTVSGKKIWAIGRNDLPTTTLPQLKWPLSTTCSSTLNFKTAFGR